MWFKQNNNVGYREGQKVDFFWWDYLTSYKLHRSRYYYHKYTAVQERMYSLLKKTADTREPGRLWLPNENTFWRCSVVTFSFLCQILNCKKVIFLWQHYWKSLLCIYQLMNIFISIANPGGTILERLMPTCMTVVNLIPI